MRTLNDVILPFHIDLGTAATQITIPTFDAGKVIKVATTLSTVITSANAVLTIKNSAAGSMGTITITQSGSAIGDVDTLIPTSNNYVVDDSFIEIETDGGPAAGESCFGYIVIRR